MLHKQLLLCICCIIAAIITVRRRVAGDRRCKMIEELDLNYITLFLFTVETANYFPQQNSTNHHPELSFHPNYCRNLWKQSIFRRAVALQWTAGFHLQHRVHNQPRLGELLTEECALPENAIDLPNATLPAYTIQEHLAECQFQNSCLPQWMCQSVTWLAQIGSESVEVLFLLAVPGAQCFTATTVSHGVEQGRTFGRVDLFLLLTRHVSVQATFEVNYQPAPLSLPEWDHLPVYYQYLDSLISLASINVAIVQLYIWSKSRVKKNLHINFKLLCWGGGCLGLLVGWCEKEIH